MKYWDRLTKIYIDTAQLQDQILVTLWYDIERKKIANHKDNFQNTIVPYGTVRYGTVWYGMVQVPYRTKIGLIPNFPAVRY